MLQRQQYLAVGLQVHDLQGLLKILLCHFPKRTQKFYQFRS